MACGNPDCPTCRTIAEETRDKAPAQKCDEPLCECRDARRDRPPRDVKDADEFAHAFAQSMRDRARVDEAPPRQPHVEGERAFWLVWSPEGASPPRFRHESRRSASEEAARLARAHHGARFYVVHAVEYAEVAGFRQVTLDGDSIPF